MSLHVLHVACRCNVGQCSAARYISLRACTARPDSTAGKRHAQRATHATPPRTAHTSSARCAPALGHRGSALRSPRDFGSAGRLTGPLVSPSTIYPRLAVGANQSLTARTGRAGGRKGGRGVLEYSRPASRCGCGGREPSPSADVGVAALTPRLSTGRVTPCTRAPCTLCIAPSVHCMLLGAPRLLSPARRMSHGMHSRFTCRIRCMAR
jgi:hypothetical protein